MNMEQNQNKKRVCLLTGASGTLGSAFCKRFGGQYQIAAVYCKTLPRVPSDLIRVIDPLDPRASLEENSHPIFPIKADLSQPMEHRRIIDLALARFFHIDLVINMAAICIQADLLASDKVLQSFSEQLYMNAFVPLSISTHLLRRSWMTKTSGIGARTKHIISISSTSSSTVYRGKGQCVYSASKAALDILTEHMAAEFEPFGVRVNAIAPDSFPSRISIDRILDAILHLDQGDSTGEIVRLN
jgi:NAD(P)-dependent dehydrogenase (short-subunit alcohol dehydrogenase family)